MQPINEGCDLSGKATSRIVITLNMSKLLEYMNHARTNERKKLRQDMYTAKSSYIWNAKILDITIYMNFKKTYRISSIGADRTFRDFAVYMSCLEVRVIGLPIRMTSMFFYIRFLYTNTLFFQIFIILYIETRDTNNVLATTGHCINTLNSCFGYRQQNTQEDKICFLL